MIDTVLDLLADGIDEAVGSIAFSGVAGGDEVTSSRGEEIAAGQDSGPGKWPRVEGVSSGYVHEVGRQLAHAAPTALIPRGVVSQARSKRRPWP